MSPGAAYPELARAAAHLAPYARHLLARCEHYALSLHADEVGPEHLLSTLMDDEDCAAHRAVLHAFADPGSISEEARALSSGIMVTGSTGSLPFSTGAVRALEAARDLAREHGHGSVLPRHLALAAERALPADSRTALESAGWSEARLERLDSGRDPGPAPARAEGSFFHEFSEASKRILSVAARAARGGGSRAIGLAHLLLASLQSDPELERAAGLSAARARLVLRGRSEDPTLPGARALAPDEGLIAFLAGTAAGGTSLCLLERFHAGGTRELSQLLLRHKVSPPLLERCRGSFQDPDPPGASRPEP